MVKQRGMFSIPPAHPMSTEHIANPKSVPFLQISTSSAKLLYFSCVTERDKTLKHQRDLLKRYQKRIELNLENDRQRAKLLLRKKKFQETLLINTDKQLENLEKLATDIEYAQVEMNTTHVTQKSTSSHQIGGTCIEPTAFGTQVVNFTTKALASNSGLPLIALLQYTHSSAITQIAGGHPTSRIHTYAAQPPH
uniref:Uncharacterized protein n=1 Tax=Glossina austeni TaxID=7395 RepID=A0A1A9V4V5_GLOAU